MDKGLLACIVTVVVTALSGCGGTSSQAGAKNSAPMLPSMISIPGGTFKMGSSNADLKAGPVHLVTISAFTMSQTLVTQEQYQAVMGANPSSFKDSSSAKLRPVETVTWFDAALYCNAASKLAGKDTVYIYAGSINSSVAINYSKNGYRLPTEAEYEYACRAGDTTDYYWKRNYPPVSASDTLAIDNNAVWQHNSPTGTQPVGGKKANAWGLFDIAGNVEEWCNDWYGHYSGDTLTDPAGPSNGASRVLRGGSWSSNDAAINLCAACRDAYYVPGYRCDYVGFRVVCKGE